jgi:hypothetical protein
VAEQMMQVYLPDNQPPDGLAQNLCLLPSTSSVYSSFFLISPLQDETDAPSNYLQILQSKIPSKMEENIRIPSM